MLHVRIASLLLALCCLEHLVAGKSSFRRFVIVSTPRFSRVSYMAVHEGGRLGAAEPLVNTGLIHPQGLAIDSKRGRLLVADPDARRILAYPLRVNGHSLSVGEKLVAADNVEARWVDVDGLGNVWFSDEPSNQIMKVSSEKVMRGTSTPEVVYDGLSLASVNGPGGVAVDTFHAYWVNKHIGTQVGSLVKGMEVPDASNAASSVRTLAANTDKSYGVCLALGNVYYTQPEKSIFGVKKQGGPAVTISEQLTNPRGCAWDGDGTVYVADRGANAIYSFAGNMKQLSLAQVRKSADYEDAFGIVVYNSGAWRCAGVLWFLSIAVFLLQ